MRVMVSWALSGSSVNVVMPVFTFAADPEIIVMFESPEAGVERDAAIPSRY